MAGSGLLNRMRNVFRRDSDEDEERDVFSASDDSSFEDEGAEAAAEDDDDEDSESRIGPKIALAFGATAFLLLGGAGAYIYFAGQGATAPMVMAPLPKLEVEDVPEPEATAALTPSTPAIAPAPAQIAKAPDIAATDRSADRRPWLNNPAAPAAKAPTAKAPDAKVPDAKVPDAKAAAPAPAPAAPPAKVAEAPPPPPPPPAAAKPAAVTPPVPPAPAAGASAPLAILAEKEPEQPAMPTLPSVLGETAPGAPDRFKTETGLTDGGRPRLNDPPAPPIDKKALSSPPPRFAGVADMKGKVTPYSKAAAAKTDPKTGRTSKITVVVRELGLNAAATEAAITKLPPAVTLSFSPYAPNLKKMLEQAKANGHEVLVGLPMESKQFPAEDPGPLGLMTSLEPKKNGERIDTILRSAPGAVGVDDDMGSKFRESEAAMSQVFAKLKDKKLFYLQTEPGTRLGEASVPNAVADVIVDERPFRAAIDARLDYAERLAKFQGSSVAVMGPKPVSFERLALWLDTLNAKGLVLTPVSEVLLGLPQDEAAEPAPAVRAGQTGPAKKEPAKKQQQAKAE